MKKKMQQYGLEENEGTSTIHHYYFQWLLSWLLLLFSKLKLVTDNLSLYHYYFENAWSFYELCCSALIVCLVFHHRAIRVKSRDTIV